MFTGGRGGWDVAYIIPDANLLRFFVVVDEDLSSLRCYHLQNGHFQHLRSWGTRRWIVTMMAAMNLSAMMAIPMNRKHKNKE